jgi:hypothetical protein
LPANGKAERSSSGEHHNPNPRITNPKSPIANPLAEPAGRGAGLAAFFLDVRDRLGVVGDLFAHAVELGERFLAIEADLIALERVVARRKVRRQGIDPGLERFREQLSPAERVALGGETLLPVLLVLFWLLAILGLRL